jgi:hypothetical protein
VFCDQYRRWLARQELVLRQDHAPGEKLFVDYAGQTVPIVDRHTGESRATRPRSRPPDRRHPHNRRDVDEIIDNDDSPLTASPPARHAPESWPRLNRNGGPASPEYAIGR